MGVDALMSITTAQPLSPDLIRETSWRLCATFGPEWFFVEPGKHQIIEVSLHSGMTYKPRLSASHSEYAVNLWGRYASLDYTSRTGLMDGYAEIAWWLEREIPGCRVWYGNDSDCVMRSFGRRERAQIYHHLVRLGHHFRPLPPTDGKCFCKFCGHNLRIEYDGEGYRLERCLGCLGSVLFKEDEALSCADARAIKNLQISDIPKPFPKALHELLRRCDFNADLIIY